MSVNEKVLDAIELLTKNSVQKAKYDKTIQAQILSCEDSTIGKYRCRYQDATFYAYSSNLDLTFSKGSEVYILVPGNDMSKEKTILGTTNKLGINFVSQAVGDEAYDIVGKNCITSNGIYYLDSDNKEYIYTIYEYNKTIDQNISIDIDQLQTYMKQSSSIVAGASFKTSLDKKKQHQGSFGIVFKLCFLDNATQSQVIRTYVIDEDSMSGVNPYQQERKTRQYQIFDIDGQNFERIESISIFNKNFPGSSGELITQKLNRGDIEVSNIELLSANRMTETELSGIAISFLTPEGTSFVGATNQKAQKTITAQIKVKGKLLTSTSRLLFYWGIEDISISPNSQYYNKHLGRGWKCLNDSNVIQQQEGQEPIIDWIPSTNKYIFNIKDATAKYTKIKVAVIYNENVITKTLTILKKIGIPDLSIESSGGTRFYFDIGHPDLTCKINGQELVGKEYSYYWGYEASNGILQQLAETEDLNNNFQEAINKLNDLKEKIANGIVLPKASEQELADKEATIYQYNFIQRVKGNKIFDVQIKNITSFGTFKCSVFKQEDQEQVYLGTAAITLTNSLTEQGEYSVVINNGSVVFQYDEEGDAPTSPNSTVQQVIKALTFTVYDNLGNAIDDEVIQKNSQWWWEFPTENTMLTELNQQTEVQEEQAEDAEFKKYFNIPSLMYGISNKYRVQYQNNQIKLVIKYKDMVLSAVTRFTFVKEGDPGTNGTEYIVRIVPNVADDSDFDGYPTITRVFFKNQRIRRTFLNYKLKNFIEDQDTKVYKDGYYQFNSNSAKLFKIEVWKSGEKIDLNDTMTLTWEILQNKNDTSNLTIDEVSGQIGFTNNFPIMESPADIVKCTVTIEGKKYYATMPVIVVDIQDSIYSVQLKPLSGFRYAVYSNDGMKPQYANLPFEIICQKKINDIWEDISLNTISNDVLKPIKYDFRNIGALEEDYRNRAEDKPLNYFYCSPISRFDGYSVTNSVICNVAQKWQIEDQIGQTLIGSIHIPIHLLLNKFGLSALNDWDGNSIQIKSDTSGSNYILSPQMGAGTKNSDNEFTGVLMGQVKNVSGTTSKSDIGLFGYADGERSFFLNSENGSAIFGKAGNGQIVIDPNAVLKDDELQSDNNALRQVKGLLYSSNFWKNYDDNGLPTYYKYRTKEYIPTQNTNQEGMLINLSQPEIFFGSGNFYVTKEGYLHASGGGDIAGWKIGKGVLTTANLTLDSANQKIYSGSHINLGSGSPGFHLSSDGLSIGERFRVGSNGVLRLGKQAVNSDTSDCWEVGYDNNGSYIKYGKSNSSNYVRIGTDKIQLGKNFSVDNTGKLSAISGTIGGWNLAENQIYWVKSSNTGSNTSNKITLDGKGGQILGPGWSLKSDGTVQAKNFGGNIGYGRALIGDGNLVFGGKGYGSSMSPNITLNANVNFSGLSGSLYTAYKAKFDTIYVGTAYVDKVIANSIQAVKAEIQTIDAGTMTVGGIRLNERIQSITRRFQNLEDSLGALRASYNAYVAAHP